MYAENYRTAARARADIDAQIAIMADDKEMIAEGEAMAEADMAAGWEALLLGEQDT
jgi:hypothetical protein